jgi:hypothetical protein
VLTTLAPLAVPGPATGGSLLAAGIMLALLLLVVVPCALAAGPRSHRDVSLPPKPRRRPRSARPSTSCPTSQGLSR